MRWNDGDDAVTAGHGEEDHRDAAVIDSEGMMVILVSEDNVAADGD